MPPDAVAPELTRGRTRLSLALALLAGCHAPPPSTRTPPPLVVAHRGASGALPEHTLAAYALAIAQGADFIEIDLVTSRDGVLFARHDHELSSSTDVAAKYPARRTTKTVEGAVVAGWFAEDFAWDELRTLRVRQTFATRDHAHDGEYPLASFDEILALVQRTHASAGVYVETKHPAYFQSIGLALEPPMLAALDRAHLTDGAFVESFAVSNLRALHGHTRARLVQLVAADDATLLTRDGLRTVATYADVIAPPLERIQPVRADGSLDPPTSLVRDAHAAGLAVHAWTFRRESVPRADISLAAQMRRHLALGVDGLFTDEPAVARDVIGPRATLRP